jgi:hypothetical protein
MFINPNVFQLLVGIQNINKYENIRMASILGQRFIGFGSTYFGAGVMNGMALILLSYLFNAKKRTTSQIIWFSFQYIIILGFGMMMARTTIIGFIISFIYLLIPSNLILSKQILSNKFRFITSILLIIIISLLLLSYAFPKYFEILNNVSKFAFEMFYNYSNKGNLETVSTNRMIEMYIFPDNWKTWLIGDGYFVSPDNNGYYMHIDIGHLRLIYYFGIIGLISYFAFQFYSIKILIHSTDNKKLKFVFMLIFLYLIILNFKGFTDLFFILILFLLIVPYNLKKYLRA